MKKFYLLIILLVSTFGFAQVNLTGEAKYHAEITVNITDATGDGCCCGGLGYLNLDGIGDLYILKNDDNTFWEGTTNILERDYTESNLATSISLYTRRRTRSGGCKITQEKSVTVLVDRNQDITYTDWDNSNISGVFAYNVSGTLRVKTYPIIDLINPDTNNNIIGTESSIIIPEIEGVKNEYFNWMYHIEGEQERIRSGLSWRWVDVWRSLPSEYQNKNSLNIKCEDFLAFEAVGKKITLRANSNGSTVELLYAKSAPKITFVDTQKTKCFDTNDGRAIIKFNSKLVEGETLTCSVSDFDEAGNIKEVVYSTQENETILIGDDLTYEIPYDFPKGKYRIKLLGWYTEPNKTRVNTYVMDPQHQYDFYVISAPSLDFTLKNTNANCIGSGDGTITITPTGGTRDRIGNDYYSLDNGVNWIAFSNSNSHIITGLIPGTYNIKVKDMNGCIARNQTLTDGEIELGDEKIVTAMISEPAAPVSLSFTSIQEPAFFGGSNGKITASITGGTPFSDNSYLYEWRNSKNEIISNAKTTTEFAGDLYAITLHDIPADTYTLTVWDANYNLATNNAACTILPAITIILTQPDPIVVTFEIKQTISCNVSNEFGNESDINPNDGQRDESQDGILVAHVTGGVPFKGFENNRMPYKYFWKKQQIDGTWISLDDETETAQNLGYGNYALNVEDKNGIRLGVYVNNILERETDSIQFMQQPSRLELELIKEDILCSQGDNGRAKANVRGGTPPYVYEWTNGKTTDTITQLTSGNYFVKVTDAKGCTVQGSILIEQPNGVVINETITNPTCFHSNDGLIHLAPTGGVTPYQYSWSTGANTQDISNLAEGNYTVTLTDAQGCIMIQNFEVTAPAPVVIDLGADRTLCLDQVLELNASIPDAKAQYEWTATNGFISDKAAVSLTVAGTYHVKVTSGFGCTGEDEIIVKTNETVIDSEFLLSSQAYLDEEVILVNTSNPFGETTKWMIPQSVTILEEKEKYIILQFKDLGTYSISLQQTQGECYAVYTKNITVEKRGILPNTGGATSSFIKDFIVTPNPSDGNFKATINLENNSPVNLRLFSSNGQYSAIEKKEAGKKNYEIDFNVTLASGIYILVLETAHQTLVKKIIIY